LTLRFSVFMKYIRTVNLHKNPFITQDVINRCEHTGLVPSVCKEFDSPCESHVDYSSYKL